MPATSFALKRYGYSSFTWKSPVAVSFTARSHVDPTAQSAGACVSTKKLSAHAACLHPAPPAAAGAGAAGDGAAEAAAVFAGAAAESAGAGMPALAAEGV